MYRSLYAYPWDVQDETPQAFCTAVQEQIGVDTISLAVSYHAGKLLLPRNPRRKVYYPEDGALFFRPDPDAFANSVIKPHVSALAQEEDVLAALCFQREVDLYTTRILPHTDLEVGLRPVLPDNQTEADFAAKVAYCAQRNVSGISFYNYGMLPPTRLRWIRDALKSVQ